MRILAIESSAVTASVAILTDDVLTAEYTVNYKKTHSDTENANAPASSPFAFTTRKHGM